MFQRLNPVTRLSATLAFLGTIVLTTLWVVATGALQSTSTSNPSITIGEWPWFENSYFNIRFQYPPDWKVKIIDVTNYYDDPQLGLMGEDAVVAGPSQYKQWILQIVPPYIDTQEVHRGPLNVVTSAITIEQPNTLHSSISLYSNVIRSADRAYESALDVYSEDFDFMFSTHFKVLSRTASTSVSYGHSKDGEIAGITALKFLPNGYQFQPFLTMSERFGKSGDAILIFMAVVDTIQLLDPEKRFNHHDYELLLNPQELSQSFEANQPIDF